MANIKTPFLILHTSHSVLLFNYTASSNFLRLIVIEFLSRVLWSLCRNAFECVDRVFVRNIILKIYNNLFNIILFVRNIILYIFYNLASSDLSSTLLCCIAAKPLCQVNSSIMQCFYGLHPKFELIVL